MSAGASSKDGYTINVDLPQAVLHDVTITDTLPQGLIYKSDSLEVNWKQQPASETLTPPTTEASLSLWPGPSVSFNKSDGQGLTLKFQPIVANVTSNRNGITLAPTGYLFIYDDWGVLQTHLLESSTAELVRTDLTNRDEREPRNRNVSDLHRLGGHILRRAMQMPSIPISLSSCPPGVVYSPRISQILSGPTSSIDNTDPGKLKWHLGEVDQSWKYAQKIVLTLTQPTERSVNSGEIVGILNRGIARRVTVLEPGAIIKKLSSWKLLHIPQLCCCRKTQIADPNPVEAGQILAYNIKTTQIPEWRCS